jgi:hypothetical protein
VIGKAVIGLSFCYIRLAFEGRRGGTAHLAHASRGVTSRGAGERRRAQQKNSGVALISLAIKRLYDYLLFAQIRTCLWPCVDR